MAQSQLVHMLHIHRYYWGRFWKFHFCLWFCPIFFKIRKHTLTRTVGKETSLTLTKNVSKSPYFLVDIVVFQISCSVLCLLNVIQACFWNCFWNWEKIWLNYACFNIVFTWWGKESQTLKQSAISHLVAWERDKALIKLIEGLIQRLHSWALCSQALDWPLRQRIQVCVHGNRNPIIHFNYSGSRLKRILTPSFCILSGEHSQSVLRWYSYTQVCNSVNYENINVIFHLSSMFFLLRS